MGDFYFFLWYKKKPECATVYVVDTSRERNNLILYSFQGMSDAEKGLWKARAVGIRKSELGVRFRQVERSIKRGGREQIGIGTLLQRRGALIAEMLVGM